MQNNDISNIQLPVVYLDGEKFIFDFKKGVIAKVWQLYSMVRREDNLDMRTDLHPLPLAIVSRLMKQYQICFLVRSKREEKMLESIFSRSPFPVQYVLIHKVEDLAHITLTADAKYVLSNLFAHENPVFGAVQWVDNILLEIKSAVSRGQI